MFSESAFQMELNGVTMSFELFNINGREMFKVDFSSKRKSMIVTKAKKDDGSLFWTSIPEGRQKEAEGVGKLIDDYFKKEEN